MAGIQHIVVNKTNKGQLWDDTLYMTVLFTSRMGILLKQDTYIQESIAELKSEDGLWHTLLDDPSSYTETSATAGFAYSILKGIRKGYLDTKYIQTAIKAVNGVLNKTDDNGVVWGVSGPPIPFQKNAPVLWDNLEQIIPRLLEEGNLLVNGT